MATRTRLKRQTTRSKADLKFFMDPLSGNLCPITPMLSSWYIWYIQDSKPESMKWAKTFRSRFRLPYASFPDLLKMVVNDDGDSSKRWRTTLNHAIRTPCSKRGTSPVAMLFLSALRYLGQGWTFDGLEESTYIHKEVHQVFFLRINEFGACKLYPTYVRMPNSIQDLQECEMAYGIAGFPGCIGSKDTTHIPLERVDYIDRQQHLGFKSSATTRTYN
jgi:hypothetical protein